MTTQELLTMLWDISKRIQSDYHSGSLMLRPGLTRVAVLQTANSLQLLDDILQELQTVTMRELASQVEA